MKIGYDDMILLYSIDNFTKLSKTQNNLVGIQTRATSNNKKTLRKDCKVGTTIWKRTQRNQKGGSRANVSNVEALMLLVFWLKSKAVNGTVQQTYNKQRNDNKRTTLTSTNAWYQNARCTSLFFLCRPALDGLGSVREGAEAEAPWKFFQAFYRSTMYWHRVYIFSFPTVFPSISLYIFEYMYSNCFMKSTDSTFKHISGILQKSARTGTGTVGAEERDNAEA